MDQRLRINIFGLELQQRQIFRQIVQIKLVDYKNGKDYILTTMSARGRGNRVSKLRDNILLVDMLLDKFALENEKGKSGNKELSATAYDGAQTLFSLRPIDFVMSINNEDALAIEELSIFLKDSLKFLKGGIEISCEPDCEKPSFNQGDIEEWQDPRFNGYLDIVTSQGAIRSGKYLSQSKGLYVNTQYMDKLKVGWALGAKGVHKGCRIVGEGRPLPILELDPQSTQYYAPITLDQMLFKAFHRDFAPGRRPQNPPNPKLVRAARMLFRDLKCNPYYSDLQKWATNTIVVHDLDYSAPMNKEYQERNQNLKFPFLPAASCGIGQQKRLYPLENLQILPYQSINRLVLEEFDLTPRANAPCERWRDLQCHFTEFCFNGEIMTDFGIRVCNDPYENVSEISAGRVDKPSISYAGPVHVDDEKRDWKARDQPFVQPSRIDVVMVGLIVGFTRNFDADVAAVKTVIQHFMNRCRDKGVQVGGWQLRTLNSDDGEHFLTSVFRELVEHPKYPDPFFTPFVLLISDDVPNIHECLKFEERMSDIPTQHVLLKNIRKVRDNVDKQIQMKKRPFDLTLDNIVMKANIKAGGVNYTADIPQDIECWRDVPTFVMGMDVAHPDRVSIREGHPSTVGLSCNAAENPYQFIGDFAYTTPRKEAIDDEILRTFTAKNVRNFAEVRGFPKKVIIFRDGVSGGEEDEAIRETEMIEQTIIAVANEEGVRDYKPSILSIVVKKRHHTRFYAQGSHHTGGLPTNPLPDTTVSGDISEFGKRQIFIQAFRPVQGTAKVPSFLVLRDDEEVSDDHVSKLVCAVCSLHQIVNSPTSIPTPVFVAHELAKRGTGLFKAYRFKHGDKEHDLRMLTANLSYNSLERLSKVRVV